MTSKGKKTLLMAVIATAVAIPANAQAQTRYFARSFLKAPPPVYKGTWTYASIKEYGACNGVTKIRTIEYGLTCEGGQCDPAKTPQTRFDTVCRVQTCSTLSYYQKIATGSSTVTDTRTFPLGTANPAEAVRSWCAESNVYTPICEMEITSTGYIGRMYTKFSPIFSDGGPNFASGLCTAG
jgi:hypothetical protein